MGAQNRTSWKCLQLFYDELTKTNNFTLCSSSLTESSVVSKRSRHCLTTCCLTGTQVCGKSLFSLSDCSLCQPAALQYWSAFPFLLSMEAIRQTSDYAITCYKALYRCVWTGCDGISVSPRHCSLYRCMYLHCTNVSQLD